MLNRKTNNAQAPTATTGIAGAAGTVVTGNPISLTRIAAGSVSALVTLTTKTATVTLQPFFQGSNDGTTFYTIKGSEGTTRTGTGAAVVTSEVLPLPMGAHAYLYVRLAVIVGVTTAVVTDDFYSCSYNYELATARW